MAPLSESNYQWHGLIHFYDEVKWMDFLCNSVILKCIYEEHIKEVIKTKDKETQDWIEMFSLCCPLF